MWGKRHKRVLSATGMEGERLYGSVVNTMPWAQWPTLPDHSPLQRVPGKAIRVIQMSFVSLLKVKKWSRSVVSNSATPWTAACQAPLPMEFSRQGYWSGLPFPSPGDIPDPEIEPRSPALQVDSLPSEPPGKPCKSATPSKSGFLASHWLSLPSSSLQCFYQAWASAFHIEDKIKPALRRMEWREKSLDKSQWVVYYDSPKKDKWRRGPPKTTC